jgi:hypothetical protein
LVYFIDDKGQINVIEPGPTFERVDQHELGEATYASPALQRGSGVFTWREEPVLHREGGQTGMALR